jgi:hypothetical protein
MVPPAQAAECVSPGSSVGTIREPPRQLTPYRGATPNNAAALV